MSLAALRDRAELDGHNCDLSGDILKIAESEQDYCLIRWTNGGFMVEKYDAPTTAARDICVYCMENNVGVVFVQKSPRTKEVKYGR